MRYRVHHLTKIAYAFPVAHARLNLRLTPWAFAGQRLLDHSLTMTVEPAEREELAGPYCVNTTRLAFAQPLSSLEVTSAFTIEVAPGRDPGDGPPVRQVAEEALLLRDMTVTAPAPYLFGSHIAVMDKQIGAWAGQNFAADAGIVRAVSGLMGVIHRDFEYAAGATNAATPPAEAFERRQGVCQDFAHIMIMALRSLGISASYSSGYLLTQPPPGKPRLVGADAMHAWVSVWCGGGLGWVGFDPTNNRLADEQHIEIARGRDYADVAPIDGIFIGSAPQKMTTAVDVQPL